MALASAVFVVIVEFSISALKSLSISCHVTLPIPPNDLVPAATPPEAFTIKVSASASARTFSAVMVALFILAVKSLSISAILTAAPPALLLLPAVTTAAAPTMVLPLLPS